MNGLSLLVALASVGIISVEWEPTSSGQRAYTIRVEPLVIDQLGEGSAIESVVDQRDRGLRNFRVVVGPKNAQTERIAASTANEVEYGWRPSETGGIEYFVQISRERLESLARGVPLECEVHSDVPEVEKIYVFIGDTKLPRELPQGVRSSTTTPRDISTIGDPRSNVAPVSGTESNLNSQRYGDNRYSTPSNTPANASDVNRNDRYGPQSPQGNVSNTQTYSPAPSSNYREQPSSPYGRYSDGTLPVPPNDNSRQPDYDYNRNQYAPQQDPYVRPQPQPPYSPPVAQTAALPQQPPYNSTPAAIVPVSVQQQPGAAAAANPTIDALTAMLALQQQKLEKPTTTTTEEPVKKSSKPLVLTTLALFASIGANAYLGWLAWSFFWRFRDAASDLSRARSNAFPASSV